MSFNIIRSDEGEKNPEMAESKKIADQKLAELASRGFGLDQSAQLDKPFPSEGDQQAIKGAKLIFDENGLHSTLE